jgi:cell wall-associated NlpC family hydrolase
MHSSMVRLKLTLLLLATAFAAGCASTTPQPSSRRDAVVEADGEISLGDAVAEIAMGMVGTPYSFGGTDPRQGFDCSGLVFYTFTQAGYQVPRTSRELFKAARKIALGDAGAGDVMFFQDQEKLSHVGIYLGDGLFVHAPATGQKVTVASIDAPYYQRHLVAVGRLLPN